MTFIADHNTFTNTPFRSIPSMYRFSVHSILFTNPTGGL
jgi:hypothetical protein